MEEIYQEFLIELYKNPLNFGKIQKPDYQAEVHNSTCGDWITLFLKIENGIVIDVKFQGSGCAISQASSSLFTEYLKGKKIDSLEKIKNNEVLALLKIDLSKNPSRMRCALLPFEALKKATKR